MSDINIKVNVVSQAAQASLGGLARQAKVTEKGFKQLNVGIKNGAGLLTTFAGNLAAIGVSKALGALSQGFSTLTASVFDSTVALEKAAVQFEVLTGSAASANAIIRDLQEFTARTPFRFDDVAKAGQRLLSFGFSIEEVKTNLEDLGDVSAASGANIGELSLIFGQVQAAGKLTGERLLQFQERAIPIGPALAQTLGVAESSIKQLVTEGAIDFATFEKAFQSLNEEGNFAFGGIDKASRTLDGRISTLADNFQIFAAKVGESISPALKAATSALTEFLQRATQSQVLQTLITALADKIPQAVQFFAEAFIFGIRTVNALRLAANAVILALFKVAEGYLVAGEAAIEFTQSSADFLNIDTSGLDKTRLRLRDLKNAARETAEDVNLNMQSIVETEEELVGAIDRGTDIIIDKYTLERIEAEKTKTAVVNAADEKARVEAAAEKRRTQALRAEQEARLANIATTQLKEDELALLKQEQEAIRDGEKTALEELKIAEEANRLAISREQEQLSLLGKINDTEVLGKAKLDIETEQVKRSIELSKLEAKVKKQQRDKEIKDQQAFFSAAVSLSNSENKTLLAIGRAAALAQLAIKTPEAVASSFAFGARIGGPPLGFAFGGIAAVAMAAQAAQIVGAKFQDGGIVGGNSFTGDQVQARVNSGEMILNRRQQANLFDIANGASGSGKPIEVTTVVQIGEEEIARAVSRQVAQGFDLGEGGV